MSVSLTANCRHDKSGHHLRLSMPGSASCKGQASTILMTQGTGRKLSQRKPKFWSCYLAAHSLLLGHRIHVMMPERATSFLTGSKSIVLLREKSAADEDMPPSSKPAGKTFQSFFYRAHITINALLSQFDNPDNALQCGLIDKAGVGLTASLLCASLFPWLTRQACLYRYCSRASRLVAGRLSWPAPPPGQSPS